MEEPYDLTRMTDTISLLRQKAEELREMGKGLPTVEKNTTRILASIKMLELNISDPLKLSTDQSDDIG